MASNLELLVHAPEEFNQTISWAEPCAVASSVRFDRLFVDDHVDEAVFV